MKGLQRHEHLDQLLWGRGDSKSVGNHVPEAADSKRLDREERSRPPTAGVASREAPLSQSCTGREAALGIQLSVASSVPNLLVSSSFPSSRVGRTDLLMRKRIIPSGID